MKKTIAILSILSIITLFYIGCAQRMTPNEPIAFTSTPTPSATSIYTATATATITITNTYIPSCYPDGSTYNFETLGDRMGWTNLQAPVTYSASTFDMASCGYGSLEIGLSMTDETGGLVDVRSGLTGLDLTGKMLVCKVYIPGDFPASGGGALYIMSGGWQWENGQWQNAILGEWNDFIYDIGNPGSTGGTPDHTNINAIGLMIAPGGGYSGSWNGKVYMDQFEIFDAPPSSTVTYTPSLTVTPGGPTVTHTDTPVPTPNAPSDPNIEFYGRWDTTDPGNYRADWGPVYIKINFTGTSVAIDMQDSAYQNNYQYSIDGGAFVEMLANTSTTYVLASGLADTTHTLNFVRRTDCTFGITNFKGFKAAPAGTFTLTAPDARPPRKLEFIGDSITCGCGNEGTGGNTRFNENGYLAFGPVASRAMNAEWSLVSRGGLGVYRNWNEQTIPPTEDHAIDYYKQTLYNSADPLWVYNTWVPDAVVIALGTNDAGTIMPTQAEFETAYTELVTKVRTEYPSTVIFCMDPVPYWTNTITIDGYIQNVVTAFNGLGDNDVHYLNVNDSSSYLLAADYIGDNTHPTVGGHQKVADRIVPQIQSVMGW